MSAGDKPRYFPATTLPPALLREVQEHCQGGYLYIPRRHGLRRVDRILRWAARGEAPRQIAVLARCSLSYVYKVLAAHPDGPVERDGDVASEDAAAVRAQDHAERQRRRRIAQLQRQARAIRGAGRAEAMQGNQHATRHGVYSQRVTPDEQALMAELRPRFLETHPAEAVETLLQTLIQLQRALAIAHTDAIERLDRRLRRLLRPELAQRRRPRADAPAVAPLDWLAEFLRLRSPAPPPAEGDPTA